MLLTTPVEGFSDGSATLLELLKGKPRPDALRQIVGLASAWAA